MELASPDNRGLVATPADLSVVLTESKSVSKLMPDPSSGGFWGKHGKGFHGRCGRIGSSGTLSGTVECMSFCTIQASGDRKGEPAPVAQQDKKEHQKGGKGGGKGKWFNKKLLSKFNGANPN